MLILASASPRRHELLLAAGIEHVVCSAQIAEMREPGEAPEAFVRRLAIEKAAAVECPAGSVVLGADTVVCVQGEVLGKPADAGHARRMLRLLSGHEHRVLTGICLLSASRSISDVAETRVWFEFLSSEEIESYIGTGEPMDKAGAYAIQGYASRFVSKIDGCYHNIVGLPVSLVYHHLKTL